MIIDDIDKIKEVIKKHEGISWVEESINRWREYVNINQMILSQEEYDEFMRELNEN